MLLKRIPIHITVQLSALGSLQHQNALSTTFITLVFEINTVHSILT
jgi:hypothetical protein